MGKSNMRFIFHKSHPLDKRRFHVSHSHWIQLSHLVPFPHTKKYQRTTDCWALDHIPNFGRETKKIITRMAATMATTMAMLNAKAFNTKGFSPCVKPSKPVVALLSMQNLPKPLENTAALTGTALAGAIFSTLSSAEPALAAQQLAEIADGDNRGLALLLPLIPAVLWVLYNILQPALNQINKMRSTKGVIIGLGLGGLAASGFLHPAEASAASELAVIAESVNDNRGQLLLFVITPAILWVLYNILQPALNQINKMRSE